MAGATVKYEKFDFGIAIGIPFDISMRYYFSNWVGLVVGLQGTVLFSIGRPYGSRCWIQGKRKSWWK
jgi:hypothetical protein